MNSHLNLFRFYNEGGQTDFIENNLSRAFVLCLKNESFLLAEYLRLILSKDDYEEFLRTPKDYSFAIDIQVDMDSLDADSFEKVYAVAMTTNKNLDFSNFNETLSGNEQKNVTDIVIAFNKTAIIIEVKRNNEDCVKQLWNQVKVFKQAAIYPKSFSWQEVIRLFEKVQSFLSISDSSSLFVKDFLALSHSRYPEWFEPKTLSQIPFLAKSGAINEHDLRARFSQAIAHLCHQTDETYELLSYSDRFGVSLPFGWIKELLIRFHMETSNYVSFSVYPGNTKTQGYHLFNRDLSWTGKNSMAVNGYELELHVDHHIKFSHVMGKYVSGLFFGNDVLKKPINTRENFNRYAGSFGRDRWSELEGFFDEHFIDTYDWRKDGEWMESFVNSGRNYVFVSLGYEVSLHVPFATLQKIDKREDDYQALADFIQGVLVAYKNLMDS